MKLQTVYRFWVHFGLEKPARETMNFSLKKNSPENMAQPARAQLKNHHYKQKLEGSIEFSKYYLPTFEAGNTAVFPIV